MKKIDRRSVWAWGMESQQPAQAQLDAAAKALSGKYGVRLSPARLPDAGTIRLREPWVRVPAALSEFCSTGTYDRAFHSFGHSFPDRVRKFRLEYRDPVDAVAFPADESQLVAVLEWCGANRVAAIPFGGGSSVAGGVTPPAGGGPVVSIDMSRLGEVLEIDPVSRAARIQGGAFGPHIEARLKQQGLTLRHFPQSFEYSTLGGWIATRSAGHYATNHTHIDDFVESVRMVTPSGVWESRRLPGSGAGPSPDRMVIGSEGVLGVITEAWVRVQAAPAYRASAGLKFPTFAAAAQAARSIVQAKLWPANCRVLDEGEAANAAGMNGQEALLVLGFESAELPVDHQFQQALRLAADAGGVPEEPAGAEPGRQGAVGTWRKSFIDMPYNWNTLLGLGLINDTFETAITWDRWPEFDRAVRSAVAEALRRVCRAPGDGRGTVTCRFTHVYPDGPAPYYSFAGLGKAGGEIEQWAEIKAAASDAIIAAGGTITHHHAVGREHAPWYAKQRPELFGRALEAVKRGLDPKGIMNPGVLINVIPP